MQTYNQCLACFERQAADVCSIAQLSPEKTQSILASARARIRIFPREQPPIRMAVEIHELIRAESGIADPYAALKKAANDVCRGLGPQLMACMAGSSRPLETATKLAIAGNIIDYGAYGLRDVSQVNLVDVIEQVLAQPLTGGAIEQFEHLIHISEHILYIADNAGECFFDVPLLDVLPTGKVTYAVRGGPVLNDATFEDAHAANIPDRCTVIDTGDHAPGILLDRCSPAFLRAFNDSDLIISKGQGNYESMSDMTEKTIVFLTKVKCEMIAQDIGHRLGSNVIKITHSGPAREHRKDGGAFAVGIHK